MNEISSSLACFRPKIVIKEIVKWSIVTLVKLILLKFTAMQINLHQKDLELHSSMLLKTGHRILSTPEMCDADTSSAVTSYSLSPPSSM